MRRVIILETVPRDNGALHIRCAFWATVPAARQPFWQAKQGAGFISAVQDGSVTAAELAALQTGAVVEQVLEPEWPPATTLAQAQGFLQQAATAWQQYVTNYNPWSRYGTFFDDTTNTWTPKAVT